LWSLNGREKERRDDMGETEEAIERKKRKTFP
jgi:hypothetical protein